MTTKNDRSDPLAELDHLVSVWGGNPARWPGAVRTRIAALSTSSTEAARMLADARALDRLLDTARDAPAPLTKAKTAALTDRIVAAAIAMPSAHAGHRDNVVALRPPAPKVQAARMPHGRSTWQTAGLMAACLMVGIYIGGVVNMIPLFQELADAVGITTVIDPSIAALSDDLSDEDTL